MRLPGFHSITRDGPHLSFEIYLLPTHPPDLSRARGSEDSETKGLCGNALALGQCSHKFIDFLPAQSRAMTQAFDFAGLWQFASQMSLPSRWIVPCSPAFYAGRVQHCLDALSDTGSSLRHPLP